MGGRGGPPGCEVGSGPGGGKKKEECGLRAGGPPAREGGERQRIRRTKLRKWLEEIQKEPRTWKKAGVGGAWQSREMMEVVAVSGCANGEEDGTERREGEGGRTKEAEL